LFYAGTNNVTSSCIANQVGGGWGPHTRGIWNYNMLHGGLGGWCTGSTRQLDLM